MLKQNCWEQPTVEKITALREVPVLDLPRPFTGCSLGFLDLQLPFHCLDLPLPCIDCFLPFLDRLNQVELAKLRKQERVIALVRFSFFTIPVLVAVVTFGSHALMGGSIDAGEVFSSLALFTLIQNYLRMMVRQCLRLVFLLPRPMRTVTSPCVSTAEADENSAFALCFHCRGR